MRSPAFDVIVAIFSKHFRMPGIPRRRIVVEIVDADSSEFHTVQQIRFSKLLNLKMWNKGGPLSPRRLLRFDKIPYFQRILFQQDAAGLLKAAELCGTLGFSRPQFHLQHRIIPRRAFY